MKLILIQICLVFCCIANAQNVGIGTSTPQYRLEVNGTIRAAGNIVADGYIGVNISNPVYGIQIQDRSLAFYHAASSKIWTLNNITTGGGFKISEDGTTARLNIIPGGNVGINNSTPDYRLDVGGDANISGAMYVNGKKGVLYNQQSSTNLRYYTFTGAFSFSNFAGHSLSGPHQVNFPANADFVGAPRVMIANYTSIGGTAGHLFSIIPSVINVSTTGFQIYFFNSSTLAATMDFTVSFVCIGM